MLQTYRRQPVTFVRGEGVRLYDADGREYFDLLSGIGVASLGHAHPGWRAPSPEQAQTLIHTSNLFYHPLQGQLAERLANLSGLPRAFFCNSGTEAVEACLKFARRYWYTKGEPRQEFIALDESFHGRTFGSLSVTSDEHYRDAVRAAAAGGDVRAGPTTSRRSRPRCRRRPPPIIAEPIQGEGGVRPLTPAFAAAITEACAKTGALFIADEVQSGLGRTGYPFYFAALGLQPHLVSVGKALGGGVPVGAALVSQEVADTISFGDHGRTYGGNLLACRAALVVLDELVGGGLLAHDRPRRRALRGTAARDRRDASDRQGGPRRRPDVGARADARRGAGRAGGARARRHRQPDGGDGRAAAAAARHHGGRERTRRSAVSMRRWAPWELAHDATDPGPDHAADGGRRPTRRSCTR